MIEVEALVKDYGTVVAVRDLSFCVGTGEVVGFLGPNGAGKTTTLRMLAGFLPATSGRIRIAGHDIEAEPRAARSCMGYMPESAPSYPELRVREYLRFRAQLKGIHRRRRSEAIEKAMTQATIADMADTLIGHLSKGYRQRLGLADALLGSPPLLILDEPTSGLDPNQIREVRSLVRELGKSHTVLVSTHILSEVEATCDRAIVISNGRLVAEGSVDTLRSSQRRVASVVLRDPQRRAATLLMRIQGIETAEEESLDGDLSRWSIRFAPGVDGADTLEESVHQLVHAGIGVRQAALEKVTLEEVFSRLTRSEPLPDKTRTGEEAPS